MLLMQLVVISPCLRILEGLIRSFGGQVSYHLYVQEVAILGVDPEWVHRATQGAELFFQLLHAMWNVEAAACVECSEDASLLGCTKNLRTL